MRSTVVHSYPVMNKKFGWGRNTAFCSYFVMNELGWERSTVVCGYLVLGVLCSFPVVNNELGQGKRMVVCGYLVADDKPLCR